MKYDLTVTFEPHQVRLMERLVAMIAAGELEGETRAREAYTTSDLVATIVSYAAPYVIDPARDEKDALTDREFTDRLMQLLGP